jgi:hypothetical protein
MTRLLYSKPGFDIFCQDFCLDFQAISSWVLDLRIIQTGVQEGTICKKTVH